MAGRKIRRGDIFYADLRPVVGSEQGGIRPVVILQNNTGGSDHQPRREASAANSYLDRRAVSWTAQGFHDITGAGPDSGFEKAT